jgi:LysM repeat protein
MNATSTLRVPGHRPAASRAAASRPAATSGAAAAIPGRLRLTRRGRFVLIAVPLMLLSVMLLLLLGVFTSPVKASTSGAAAIGTQAVKTTVLSGQTLWSIAAASDPSRDPRDVISDIVELNNLATSVVQPGQQLFVPQHS